MKKKIKKEKEDLNKLTLPQLFEYLGFLSFRQHELKERQRDAPFKMIFEEFNKINQRLNKLEKKKK